MFNFLLIFLYWPLHVYAEVEQRQIDWKELCTNQAKIEKSKESYLVAVKKIQEKIAAKKISRKELKEIKEKIVRIEKLIVSVDKLINYKNSTDAKNTKQINEIIKAIRLELLELHNVRINQNDFELICEDDLDELHKLVKSLRQNVTEVVWKDDEGSRKREFDLLGLDHDFLDKEKCFELIDLKLQKYQDEMPVLKDVAPLDKKLSVSGLVVNTQNEKLNKKKQEENPEKKKKQVKIFDDAKKTLDQAEKNNKHLPKNLKLLDFQIKADDAFGDNELSEKEKNKIISRLNKNIEKYKNVVAKIRDPQKKISEAVELFYQDYLHNYEPENGQMRDLLSGDGGNCDTRAIFLYHVLAQKLKLSPGEHAQYAVEVFDQHVQLVIYKKDPKSGVEEVIDLLTGKTKSKADAPIFTDALLVKSLLVGQKKDAPDEIKKYQIAGPVLNLEQLKTSKEESLNTNSPRALPLVGVKFNGSMKPNKNSLSPKQYETLKQALGNDLNSDKHEIEYPGSPIKLEHKFKLGIVSIKSVALNEKANKEWLVDSMDNIVFKNKIDMINFLGLKTDEEKKHFLIRKSLGKIKENIESKDFQSFLDFFRNPLSPSRDSLKEFSQYVGFYSVYDNYASYFLEDEQDKLEFRNEASKMGLIQEMKSVKKLIGSGVDIIQRNPNQFLMNLSSGHNPEFNYERMMNAAHSLMIARNELSENSSLTNLILNDSSDLKKIETSILKKIYENNKVIFKKNPEIQKLINEDKLKTSISYTNSKSEDLDQEKKDLNELDVMSLFFILRYEFFTGSIWGRDADVARQIAVKWNKEVSEGVSEVFKLNKLKGLEFERIVLLIPYIQKTREQSTNIFPAPQFASNSISLLIPEERIPKDVALMLYSIMSNDNFIHKKYLNRYGINQVYFDKLADSLSLPRKKMKLTE